MARAFRGLCDIWADTMTAHHGLVLTVLGGLAEFKDVELNFGDANIAACPGSSDTPRLIGLAHAPIHLSDIFKSAVTCLGFP